MVVWEPIGKVEADWETMISNTPWKRIGMRVEIGKQK